VLYLANRSRRLQDGIRLEFEIDTADETRIQAEGLERARFGSSSLHRRCDVSGDPTRAYTDTDRGGVQTGYRKASRKSDYIVTPLFGPSINKAQHISLFIHACIIALRDE